MQALDTKTTRRGLQRLIPGLDGADMHDERVDMAPTGSSILLDPILEDRRQHLIDRCVAVGQHYQAFLAQQGVHLCVIE